MDDDGFYQQGLDLWLQALRRAADHPVASFPEMAAQLAASLLIFPPSATASTLAPSRDLLLLPRHPVLLKHPKTMKKANKNPAKVSKHKGYFQGLYSAGTFPLYQEHADAISSVLSFNLFRLSFKYCTVWSDITA